MKQLEACRKLLAQKLNLGIEKNAKDDDCLLNLFAFTGTTALTTVIVSHAESDVLSEGEFVAEWVPVVKISGMRVEKMHK